MPSGPEEAEEQLMQKEDAARRLAILRGEIPPPLEEPHPDETLPPPPPAPHGRDRDTPGRKRKRHGEDDTDFEMRIARERTTAARELTTHTTPTITTSSSAPLLDSKGHLTLFPEPDAHTARSREGHPDAEREAARKERELKDQYQMRLVNAAGRDGAGLTDGGPWYASSAVSAVGAGVGEGEGAALGAPVVPSKNVFGREDPGRGARAAARLDASDLVGGDAAGGEDVATSPYPPRLWPLSSPAMPLDPLHFERNPYSSVSLTRARLAARVRQLEAREEGCLWSLLRVMLPMRADRHVLRVESVTVQVRWWKGRGGGVKWVGVVVGGGGGLVGVVVYLEGRRMVMGDCGGEEVVMVVGC
ncbi:hypothetical protein CHGG_08134 [Chaetomium globosum CBS 148.51]|uniref:Uncharacterized protein n=1 Tax=Chaetomium globosum (strain ATCC 6205 / CBS 148.51 / DSM 1962 / NBRC 6347 / NRRL 1970) TaxID=306901 RepID=Q2GV70_CHAGB|nr:uncharacterized protein CHGG_08134 [Chaetomium globosum CBS 148.51]EAQ86881.1 hypothetical protein CHGG_08134 [Chaetomium globosum CBS 148.51]